MSQIRLASPIEISSVDRNNLYSALESVRGYLKTTSIFWMRALQVPILSGIVVSDWSQKSARLVEKFAREHKTSELLLRIDKHNERWTRRRGGYLIPVSGAGSTAKALKEEGLISLFLEPVDPLADEYSMAAVTIPDQGKLVIEIVGAGFDASDILRSDVSAHERWEFKINAGAAPTVSHSGTRLSVASPQEYEMSVEKRLAKIGARLSNAAFPDEVPSNEKQLVSAATSFLRSSGQTRLLDSKEYQPISPRHLEGFINNIELILLGLGEHGIRIGSTSFAASVVPQGRLVFWDFFPAAKEEAALLYPAA